MNRLLAGWILTFVAAAVAVGMGIRIQQLQRDYLTVQQQAALMLNLIENSRTAVVVINDEGVVEFISQGAETLFGITKETTAGASLSLLMSKEHWLRHVQAFECVERPLDGIVRVINCDIEKMGKTIPLQIEAQHITIHNRGYWLGLINNRSQIEFRDSSVSGSGT